MEELFLQATIRAVSSVAQRIPYNGGLDRRDQACGGGAAGREVHFLDMAEPASIRREAVDLDRLPCRLHADASGVSAFGSAQS